VVIPPQLLAPAGTTTLAPATPPAAVPAAPPPAPSPPKRREHRVVASARASQKAPPPPEMKALDGSHPEYPDAYEDTDTKGEVTVTCIVQPDGSATKCQILRQTGGAAFGNAVLHWLARDTTRFPPLLRKGHPAALPFTWNIDFFP
jgi:TonB family protein